jgi:hypothetical protein
MDAAEELTREILEALEKVQRGMQTLVDAVNRTLALVPDVFAWVVEEFRRGWDAVLAKLQEFWDWFTDKLSYVGNPFMLHGAAQGWREVGGLVSNQVREIDDSDLTVDDNWNGRGADQYRQSLAPQREALTSIDDDFANNIAAGLVQLSIAITVFWGSVVTAIIALVVGLATATGEAVTIIGIPLVPPTALGAIAIAIGAVTAGTIVLFANAGGAEDNMAKTQSGVQSWPAFVTA